MRFHYYTTTFLAPSLVLGIAGVVGAQAATSTENASGNGRPESLRLHHRIFHPSRPSEPFVDRGSITLSYPSSPTLHAPYSANFVPSDTQGDGATSLGLGQYVGAYVQEVEEGGEGGEKGRVDWESAVYQLALEHPGDTQSSQWHVSSVKVVRLSHPSSLLHPSSSPSPPLPP